MGVTDSEYIVHGPEFHENVPNESYGKTFYRHLKNNCHLPFALVDAITRKHISYKTLFEHSLRLAHCLQKWGITQNDVIAISSENNMNYIFPVLAGFYLGATVTLYNPLYTLREITHVAHISKPTIIFCSTTSLQSIIQTQKELKYLKKIIVLGDYSSDGDIESMDNFIAKNSIAYKSFEPVDVDPQKVALILYSSGTTGLPKGVMITHYNLNVTLIFFTDPRYFAHEVAGTSATLCLMPFFHTIGLTVLSITLLCGGTAAVLTRFEGKSFLQAVQDFKIRSMMIVPPIANFLAHTELVNNYDLSHMEEITSGGAPLSKTTEELLLKRFNKVQHIRQGYGLTEATAVAAISLAGVPPKKGLGSKLLPKCSLKILDLNTRKPLGYGKKGEIYIKGPQIMKGYAGDADSTKDVFDAEGWLKTGDIGYYDKDGYLYIVDRLKELIKYKGFQVPPAELEGILLEHPKIVDAAVIGLPDQLAGEVPLAFVVKIPGQALTEIEVQNYVAEQVSPQKRLRGGVQFVPAIPKNPSGKILKTQLRQLLSHKSKL